MSMTEVERCWPLALLTISAGYVSGHGVDTLWLAPFDLPIVESGVWSRPRARLAASSSEVRLRPEIPEHCKSRLGRLSSVHERCIARGRAERSPGATHRGKNAGFEAGRHLPPGLKSINPPPPISPPFLCRGHRVIGVFDPINIEDLLVSFPKPNSPRNRRRVSSNNAESR